ncbi:MAG: ABC transporter substrate-binding protein [Lachnospiraceae bacterium]|nr:ABC transporter substrate-binding protein [Lachnospiraceae bacterium]
MRKKSIVTKTAALFTAAAVCVTAVGCGAKEQDVGGEKNADNSIVANITEESVNGSEQKGDAGNSGMGRYVETTAYKGENLYDKVERQILSDGQMVFLNSLSTQKIVSEDGGETWNAEVSEGFAGFIDEHYPAASAIAKDGTIAIVGMDKRDGTESEYDFNLYIYNTDDTAKQIPIELPDTDSNLRRLAFDEEGTLYVFASGCRNIYRVDISAGTSEKLVTLEDTTDLIECRDGILMCLTFEKIFLYDLEKKIFIEDAVLDNFIEENYKDMAWTGSGYTAYAFFGADKAIYVAGEKGLHRHVIGGGAVEQVIDGSLSSLGDPTYSILSMMMNDKNEFFAVYNDGKIVKFAYDAAVPTVPNDKITVYSLSEDDLVKQTISSYQTQYPDMFIEYQIGMDEGGVTREDALKKLNTQLLSGSGPDVIMLDGINIDTYAEKGVLMDLSDVVNETDQRDGLYRNLIEKVQTDDKMYAVPAKFCIPVILGDENYVGSAKDYQSIADMAEKARGEYPDTSIMNACSATGIMRRFMPVCAPTWKDDKGQLDQSKVREFLEQSKRLYDVEMNGTPKEYIQQYQQNMISQDGRNFEEDKYFMMTNDTLYMMQETPFAYGEVVSAGTYRDMLSVPRIDGLEDTMIKLMSGQCDNVYHPASIAGINSATKNADAAKQFVGMMLGATVQETIQFGIPVNKKALPAQFAYDESDLGDDGGQYYMGFSMKDGKSFEYTIYPVNQDGIDKLEAWIAQLDTPYLSDTVLEAAVYAEGAKYLEGTQDIDAAVKAIVDSVEIYLYE